MFSSQPVSLDDLIAVSRGMLQPHKAAIEGATRHVEYSWRVLCATQDIPSTINQAYQCKSRNGLALRVHGSLEALATKYPLDPLDLTAPKADLLTWYRQAPLRSLSQDPLRINDVESRPRDKFCGIGAIPYPTLLNSGSEQGLWCRGCELTYEDSAIEDMDLSTLSRLVPEGCDADQFLRRMQYRAWSKADFLQHAKHCHSAAAVIFQR
jgi:hypothetical protein